MANRRMFARTVTGSGRFLRLDGQSRLLYFQLGMEADDDGFAEAYAQLVLTGAGLEHLNELENAGFITICDRENLVVYITHWRTNNLIRSDRYTPSIYRDVYPNPEKGSAKETAAQSSPAPPQRVNREEPQQEPSREPENQEEAICQEDGCSLGDRRLTQVRLGKISFIQDSIGQHRLRTGEPRGRKAGDEKTASPKAGEAEMIFEKKRQKPLDILLNSKHFESNRAPPDNCLPV